MTWIKRNLFFVVGSLVALALMGLAGWYLYGKWQLNNAIWEDLNTQYEALDHLSKERPHPGSGKIDNMGAAKKQQEQLQAWLSQATAEHFKRVRPIPAGPRITADQFSSALNSNIVQLNREAMADVVTLAQPAQSYSFDYQRKALSYAASSLPHLAVQLGEVKTICDVLFKSGINTLENVRRERVSADDLKGPATDYLDIGSVTNGTVILTPYEITFTCSSSELASVMAGFANSPNVLVVKAVSIQPAAPALGDAATNAVVRPRGRGGLVTVIDEKRLDITLLIHVIKLR